MSLKFKKTKENFVCQNCGQPVLGTGYTDHCPKCLWSRHVDEFPGDRKADCGGMMRPVGVEKTGEEYDISYRCEKCGTEKNCKAAEDDDFEAILGLARESVEV